MVFGLFPSFFDRPSKIRFEHQEEDEHIELFLRQHWITNVPWIFFGTLAYILPVLVLNSNLLAGLAGDFVSQTPLSVLVGALFAWYMLVTAYVLENFLHWYFNIYIATNHHLEDINFINLLRREKLEVGLENIESASSKINGVIRSLFNYGDVIVQTAAETQQISFLAVPFPDFVVDRINDLRRLAGGGNAH